MEQVGAVLAALAAFFSVTPAMADVTFPRTILSASFETPTARYAHGILGDSIEFGALRITSIVNGFGAIPRNHVITLPETRVFEDVAPRLADVTGDGKPEVIVVETDLNLGASLAVYDASGKLAATPYIGQRNRWLAPIGAADFDGDGHIELAYIDRPHLAKTLRVWRYENQKLTEIASLPGLTNHRIGEADIGGGVRICDGLPQMVMASADWQRVMIVGFEAGKLIARDAGPHEGRSSLNRALKCP